MSFAFCVLAALIIVLLACAFFAIYTWLAERPLRANHRAVQQMLKDEP